MQLDHSYPWLLGLQMLHLLFVPQQQVLRFSHVEQTPCRIFHRLSPPLALLLRPCVS